LNRNKAIIQIVFVCPHTYLPKKTVDLNVFIEFLKKNFCLFVVFTEIWIPKPKFGSGFSHSVRIPAALSQDKD